MTNIILFIIIGIVAGILSGMFGIGGGIIIFTALVIWSGYNVYSQMSTQIPFEAPINIIRYNGKSVQTSLGDHNWIPKNVRIDQRYIMITINKATLTFTTLA